MREIVAEIGKQFLGKPYEAHTLDGTSGEILVTNLQSFDCVTLIENVLALARCVKSNRLSFAAYSDELRRIRYRGGVLAGYSSRLHYFGEWIQDNDRKGIVQEMTKAFNGKEQTKVLNFMTTHRKSYAQLSQDSLFQAMKLIEQRLSLPPMVLLPKDKIQSSEPMIQTGDIIGITTTIQGLDVTHTGIAVRASNGELHYLHAPNTNGNVTISAEPLWKYVGKNPKNSGIMIARPVDFFE